MRRFGRIREGCVLVWRMCVRCEVDAICMGCLLASATVYSSEKRKVMGTCAITNLVCTQLSARNEPDGLEL